MTSQELKIQYKPIADLTPYQNNARTHSRRQVKQIAKSIERFGFTNPILISDNGGIIAGHGRVRAAQLLGMSKVPVVKLSHLSEAERQAYVLADNKLALNAGWDEDILAIELQGLIDLDFDMEVTGFELAEIDLALSLASDDQTQNDADTIPVMFRDKPITQIGDVWILGQHKLLCGDAQQKSNIDKLVDADQVDMVFTDPPYNVEIDGNVCGKGQVKHKEFAFASGEMSTDEFSQFLSQTLSNAASVCKDGAIAFICMDWRHMRELMDAGDFAFDALKNLCVWNKTNGGMGSFYRSKHELIFVYKKGSAAHTNSFGLGDTGRYRTNVWDYAGISSMSATRGDELEMHPTVKPVAMIEDAIKDCSRRRELILDIFGGSGSTLIAAERTGRRARLIEYEPQYCDTIIERWQRLTGEQAILERNGYLFDNLRAANSDNGCVPNNSHPLNLTGDNSAPGSEAAYD